MSDQDYIKALEKDNESLRKKVEELTKELSSYNGYNLNNIKYSMPKQPRGAADAIRNAILKDYLNKNKTK